MLGADTENDLNRSLGGYVNIKEHEELKTSNWQMLRSLEKEVHPGTQMGDWMDGLIVGLNFLQNGAM